ncbi:MAG: histidine kinase [Mariprofundaceae bacterium]
MVFYGWFGTFAIYERGFRSFIGCVMAAVLMFVSCSVACADVAKESESRVVHMEQAWFIASEAAAMPLPSDPGWRKVTLPHYWHNDTAMHAVRHGWYRFSVNTKDIVSVAGRENVAIHIPHVSTMVKAYWNGVLVLDGGHFSEPMTRLWQLSQLLNISAMMRRDSGQNTLALHVAGYPYYSNLMNGLSGVDMGALAILEPRHRLNLFLQADMVYAVVVFSCLMGLCAWLLWRQFPQDRVYLYFSLMNLIWAAFSIQFPVRELPVSAALWEWYGHVIVGWFVLALLLFIHQIFPAYGHEGGRRQAIERMTFVYVVAGSLLLLLPGEASFTAFSALWLLGIFCIGLYITGLSIMSHSRGMTPILLASMLLLISLLALHDLLLQFGLIYITDLFLLIYGPPLMFAALLPTIVARFTGVLNQAERLKKVLATCLDERTAQLHVLQQGQDERRRIMRDLHDSVGNRLVSAIPAARMAKESEKMETLVRNAMDDLHMVVDSFIAQGEGFDAVLAAFRERMNRRFARLSVRLTWLVNDTLLEHIDVRLSLLVLRKLHAVLLNYVQENKPSHVYIRVIPYTCCAECAGGVRFFCDQQGGARADDWVARKASDKPASQRDLPQHAQACLCDLEWVGEAYGSAR